MFAVMAVAMLWVSASQAAILEYTFNFNADAGNTGSGSFTYDNTAGSEDVTALNLDFGSFGQRTHGILAGGSTRDFFEVVTGIANPLESFVILLAADHRIMFNTAGQYCIFDYASIAGDECHGARFLQIFGHGSYDVQLVSGGAGGGGHVPVPATFLLIAAGLLGLTSVRKLGRSA